MVLKSEIKFANNREGTYIAGQVISGVVEINLDDPKNVRSLQLKVQGFAYCSFTRREIDNVWRKKRRLYSGKEDYISTNIFLLGSESGHLTELPRGFSSFNFSCLIPELAPTSFESKHGHVRYSVTLVVDRPGKPDITNELPFTVLKQLDLNHEPLAIRSPSKIDITKRMWFGFSEKSLQMTLLQKVSAYTPGSSIDLTVEINNQTELDIKRITVSLKKIITYISQRPRERSKEIHENQSEVRGGPLKKLESGKFDLVLAVPAVKPTNVNYCKVIKLSYVIQAKAYISGMHRHLRVRLPVTIGTVPIGNTANTSFSYPSAPPPHPSSPSSPGSINNYGWSPNGKY